MTTVQNRGGSTLAERIDTMESTYEYMLAFAAQGRRPEEESSGPSIREAMQRAEGALEGLAAMTPASLSAHAANPAIAAFVDLIKQDAAKSLAAVRFVLAQPAIGSQLIDNLNASIHLRALLTDLFLIDESLKKA